MKLARASGTLGLAALAVIASPLAVADDTGWFVGGNIGQSRTKIDDPRITANLLSQGLTTTSIVDRNRSTGYKLFGGYQVNSRLALEGGYFDLGKFGFTSTTTPAGTLTGNLKLKGVSVGVVGMLPVTENFSVFGRLGLNYAQTRTSFTGTGAGVGVIPMNANPTMNQINYKFGGGLQYDLTKSLGLRAEVERYRINDAVGNKGDIDLYSLGLVYRFGVEEHEPDQRMVEPAPAPVVVAPIVVAPAPVQEVVVPPPVYRKAVFSADSSADSLFDFGKADVKPAGKVAIDKFTTELKGADYEVITVTGHTDRIGSHSYNQQLSQRRADMVKIYILESTGIPSEKIEALGVDGSEPVTKPDECKGKKVTAALKACLAPDRRVEVEVKATRTAR